MEGRPLLDVVIRDGTAVLELLADENKELDVQANTDRRKLVPMSNTLAEIKVRSWR